MAPSTKTTAFARQFPDYFFQGGIQEHNTATIAGAVSTVNLLSFFADFGVFGIDETYNQHRLNDINGTNLKLICTHVGLDVGEDGNTHQCIDYVGVIRNLFGYKVIIPADPNQNVTFTYDSTSVTYGIGRLTGRNDPSGSYVFHYDPHGNLTREDKTIGGILYTTQYIYNNNNLLTSITYPSGRTVTYTLNQTGRISQVNTTLV